MSRFQDLVEERDKTRRDIEALQERLRDLRIRQAVLECALDFAVPDSKVFPVNPDSSSLKKAV